MKHANTLSGPEDELTHERRQYGISGWWKWTLVLVLGGFFIYRSSRPVIRLRSNPPRSFYDHSNARNQAARRSDRRLANEYWQVAVERIQTRYSSQRSLPSDPPLEFRLSDPSGASNSDVAASRDYYWNRLREVWKQSDAWDVSYGWNLHWVESAVNSFPEYIPQWVSNIFQSIIIFFNDLAQTILLH